MDQHCIFVYLYSCPSIADWARQPNSIRHLFHFLYDSLCSASGVWLWLFVSKMSFIQRERYFLSGFVYDALIHLIDGIAKLINILGKMAGEKDGFPLLIEMQNERADVGFVG